MHRREQAKLCNSTCDVRLTSHFRSRNEHSHFGLARRRNERAGSHSNSPGISSPGSGRLEWDREHAS